MHILEQFTHGKRPEQSLSEDLLFVSDSYIAVIDGATAKTPALYGGKSTGRVAAELVYAALATADPLWDASTLMRHLNSTIHTWYTQAGILETVTTQTHERVTATVAVYSRHHNEVWVLGDCIVSIDGTVRTNEKYIDEVTSSARALFVSQQIAAGISEDHLLAHDTGRDYIQPLLKHQSLFQNSNAQSEFYYAQLDGFFTDTSHIRIHTLTTDAKEIILATDGYTKLFPTLAASEAYLHTIITEDPLMYRLHKGPKGIQPDNDSYDDRTYVRIAL
jgi:serine/threonine protein phosphatase PrpC